ncbi:hypothetical protein [Burkholderia gladioli]|uniref:hypothetical protein n=1 Tax=Burkholderia gladioli TaxID=28095 RepID=UPI0016407199|nr:hypothetical protein [Burkholderia gladioli]
MNANTPEKRAAILLRVVPFYLLLMGAVTALLSVFTALAHSWPAGVAALLSASSACFVAWQTGNRLATAENMQRPTLVTAEIVKLARVMLEKGQDWSPEADKLLSADNSLCLCSYPDGAWIADTHGEVNMTRWTKLECVIARP